MSKTAIIALGGNALSQKKQAGTIAEQFNNTRHSFEQIMEFLRRDYNICLLYTSPSPRDRQKSRMPSSA